MPSLTLAPLRRAGGMARSLFIYWRPGRQRSLQRLYRPFIAPGDIAFDVGAHLGDRSAAFQALGARVIALEPQPALAKWFQRLLKRPDITLLPLAVGPRLGVAEIAISEGNPTLSTLANDWRHQVGERNPGFHHVRWEQTLQVDMTTLDALIERYGTPRFIKIDVEGFEAEVLQGLHHPVAALSVEFVAGMLEVSHACLEEIQRLGEYRFNAIAGERRRFLFEQWLTPEAMQQWLAQGAGQLASGDIYACRHDHPILTDA
ncbi:FkbM family methyltransferase [Halomonas sp. BC2]|uniref:FkbM family methyltransferase n=1 Tax=Halomonas sp. BC2 TaxID=1670449 RepID=UPI0009BE267D|nr:FkbM family methyltransferase [Halomonas sp. BC2]